MIWVFPVNSAKIAPVKTPPQMTLHSSDFWRSHPSKIITQSNTPVNAHPAHLYGLTGEKDVLPPGAVEHTSYRGNEFEGEDLCQIRKSNGEH